MSGEKRLFPRLGSGRARPLVVAAMAGVAALTAGGVIMPKPALAWWRGGVWIAGPAPYPYYAPRPYYYAPRPYYYAPPVVVAPPPPVYYAPPPVYYPPAPAPYPVAAHSCYAAALSCPMEVPRAPGSACYCSEATGYRSYGTAH